MQVIFVKDVSGIGKRGQTKNVAEGFAKNFLFPRNLAMPVSKGTLKHVELQKAAWDRHEHIEREKAVALGKKCDTITLRVRRKAGENGKLFGSVTTQELAEMLSRELQVEVEKRQLECDHIKELGKHEIEVKLFADVKATVKVLVEADEEAPAPAAPAAPATETATAG